MSGLQKARNTRRNKTGRFVRKHCKLNVFCSDESHQPDSEDQASCHDRDDHSYSAIRSFQASASSRSCLCDVSEQVVDWLTDEAELQFGRSG